MKEDSAIMLRFLKSTVPEWSGSGDWATGTIDRLATKGSGSETVIRGEKAIEISLTGETGRLSVTVEHKSLHE